MITKFFGKLRDGWAVISSVKLLLLSENFRTLSGHGSLTVFDEWGENKSNKQMQW